MFGYVRIDSDQLKGIDRRAYKKMYCGLCHQIGKYSQIARLSLSFDMVFFLILSAYDHVDIADACTERKCIRSVDCPAPVIDYWAGISVMMIWHKLKNDVMDGEKLKQGTLMCLGKSYKRAVAKFPETDGAICEALRQIARLETEKTDDPDAIMTVFGNLAVTLVNESPLSSERDALLQKLLASIAYEIGVWIYCMDFYDDLELDQKKNQYNPLLVQAEKEQLSIEQIKERFRKTIDSHVEELQRLCAFIPYDGFRALILNVLHDGVISVTSDVYSGCFRARQGRSIRYTRKTENNISQKGRKRA